MTQSIFLQAFHGANERVPVWFMRQAGRYLPEYQALKAKYSLDEMFETPEIAAAITRMPVDILGVDAAILFADILTLPKAMGVAVTFDNHKGPVIDSAFDLNNLRDFEKLDYLSEIIQLTNQQLPAHIPLIGFAGSPFTVLSYLISGEANLNFPKIFKFIYENPVRFHDYMQKLTVNTIRYINFQKKAGIKAYQIFDTWAGVLQARDFEKWVLPYAESIFNHIDLPSIYYVKNCRHLLGLMNESGADMLSVCQTVELGSQETLARIHCGVQGNLFNGLVYAKDEKLEREVEQVLTGGAKHKRFIFNLSHGIFPDTSVEKLKLIVNQVHAFQLSR